MKEYLQLDEDYKDMLLCFSANNSGNKISKVENIKSEKIQQPD